jgi:hypothetical protein
MKVYVTHLSPRWGYAIFFVFSGGSEDSTPGFMLSPTPGLKTNNTKAFEAVELSCGVRCYDDGFMLSPAPGLKNKHGIAVFV